MNLRRPSFAIQDDECHRRGGNQPSLKASQNLQQISLIWQYSFAQKTPLILRTSTHLYYEKYTPTTQPKTSLTLQIFQKTFFWLVSN